MNKCQCLPPDYIKVPSEHGGTDTYLLKGFGTFLYGKKATTECEICGVGLCEDCWTFVDRETESMFYPGLMVLVVDTLCSSCAEVR
jgi:hypothetical protein